MVHNHVSRVHKVCCSCTRGWLLCSCGCCGRLFSSCGDRQPLSSPVLLPQPLRGYLERFEFRQSSRPAVPQQQSLRGVNSASGRGLKLVHASNSAYLLASSPRLALSSPTGLAKSTSSPHS